MSGARIPIEIIGSDLAKLIMQHLNFVCARHDVHIQLRHVITQVQENGVVNDLERRNNALKR